MKSNHLSIRHLFLMFLPIVLLGILSSCSKGSNADSDSSSESAATEDVQESNSQLAPVFVKYHTERGGVGYSIAFKSNAGYLAFDNDGDYAYLCAPAEFLDVVSAGLYSQDFGYEGRDWEKSQEYINILKELPMNVSLYLSGRKNDIADRRVFRAIDKAYYNRHPERWYFYLRDEGYNYKNYKTNTGEFLSISPSERWKESGWNREYLDLDNNPLPAGVLVAD